MAKLSDLKLDAEAGPGPAMPAAPGLKTLKGPAPAAPDAGERMREGLRQAMRKAEAEGLPMPWREDPHYRVGVDVGEGESRSVLVEVGGGSSPTAVMQAGTCPGGVLSSSSPSDLSVAELTRHPFAYLKGPAGTGKTFLARQIIHERDDAILIATTGIAATNLGDCTTINALLGYFDTQSLQENWATGRLSARLRKLRKSGIRLLVLDEVSMLDAAQLSVLCQALDDVNLKKSYDVSLGSVELVGDDDLEMRLLLVGDFAQLPPVKAPFAFSAPEWSRFAAQTFSLETIRRQGDQDFVRALQAVRRGDAQAALPILEPSFAERMDFTFDGTTIVATNNEVDRINQLRHAGLKGELLSWKAIRSGEQQKEWLTHIPESVDVKVGALVMVLANLSLGWDEESHMPLGYAYVNGDLGVVEGKEDGGLRVKLQRTSTSVVVKPLTSEWKEATGKKNPAFTIKGAVTRMPLRLAYATTVHKCVSAGTRVQTALRGIVSIAELHPGDLLPGGQVRAVVPTMQEAFRIDTSQGFCVIASADHRWQTEQGLRTTTELLPGVDRLQLAVGHPTGGADFDEDTAYWLGLLVGDGSYTDSMGATLHFSAVDHPELGETFARGALRLGAARCSWRKDRRGLHTTSRAVFNQLLRWGVEPVLAPLKRIPPVIWEAHSGVWGAFLRGLFDTDGSVGQSGVIFCSASQGLARDVQELLLALGVVARCQQYPGRKDPYWQVYIPAKALAPFRAHVGLRAVKKVRRLAELLPNRSLHPSDTFDTVARVTPLETVLPMIDVEITAPHLMGFGPFVGHNSQGLSLDSVQVGISSWMFGKGGVTYVALSRARTLEGLRIVGNAKMFLSKCAVDPRVVSYL